MKRLIISTCVIFLISLSQVFAQSVPTTTDVWRCETCKDPTYFFNYETKTLKVYNLDVQDFHIGDNGDGTGYVTSKTDSIAYKIAVGLFKKTLHSN